MTNLSVLIPCYNSRCLELVTRLSQLLVIEQQKNTKLLYEIVVADDGSTDKAFVEHNKAIDKLKNCRYIIRKQNVGRAAIRNFLAQEAKYEWLLFIDCDMVVPSDNYIKNILSTEITSVAYGGYVVRGNNKQLRNNLRYIYEKKYESRHIATVRIKNPYHDFHTSNFIVRRDIMLRLPFDENIRKYGYEDVLWGKNLKYFDIHIQHIDNPLSFEKYEDNPSFIAKTEEAMSTLKEIEDRMRGYSHIITYSDRINQLHLSPLLKTIYKLSGKSIRNNLTGNKPRLFLFNIYKLMYYNSLT